MKKHNIILLVALILVTSVLLSACSQTLDTRLKQMESISKAKQCVATTEIKDNNVVVYRCVETSVVEGNVVTATTVESKLDSTFTLAELQPTTNQVDGIPAITLEKQQINFSQLNENELICCFDETNASVISDVFGLNAVATGDVTIVCTFNGNKLMSVQCDFVSTSNRTVVITYQYIY